ncbi:hypothetical protein DY120_00700 [Apilactobacillus micheneri]|uniref:Uncharacterized protein n=1 Tax=Apilactobacillus micheneri TaxID=1899430 RepID=A0ABY2Z0A9_9LACO|nr:recombinase family protein [Apilactobacillus micheneri]TPR26249.1 hypothetical protein DY114_00700 [Apilactobacillus micheneri]TPR27003.1 hypothetical protein DY111_00700 [Apilactobacillus micheneri]TPR27861.1 hypothetical protein DY113_04475 [Apilactobacillus micheneri]TPR31766.1 hypothetical protein DY117_00700 [Apilactobacillus micheneri]TPR32170.1 hypothetical protein DY120_00700 [Apilactobacillus micheneri]
MENNIALGYARVSTPKQVKLGNSLSNQVKMIKEYANHHNLNLTIYSDKGISGYKINKRPHLEFIVNKIKNGDINYLIVSKLDRLSRNAKDMYQIMDLCHKHNVVIVSIIDNISTNDNAMTMFNIEIMAAVAEFQRSIIKENVISSIQYKLDNNLPFGGNTIPLGYKVSNNKIKIVDNESRAIKYVYQCSLKYKYGYRTIVNKLYKKYDIDYSIQGVKKLLSNPIYAGQSSNQNHPSYNIFPAIISIDTFDKVQTLMKNKKVNKYSKQDDVFKRQVYCPICKHRLGINYVNNKYEYYYCWYGINRANTSVNFHRFRINAQSIKKAIFKYINSYVENEVFLDSLIKRMKTLLGANKTDIYKQFENNQLTVEELKNQMSKFSSNSDTDNQVLVENLQRIMDMNLHDILSIIIDKILIDTGKQFVQLYIGASNIKIYI